MESPSPVPLALVVKYGLKMSARRSGAMPHPVSATSSASSVPSIRARTISLPPSGMACTALRNKLSNTCVIRSRSSRTDNGGSGSSASNRILRASISDRTMSRARSTSSFSPTSVRFSTSGRAKSRRSPTTLSRRSTSLVMMSAMRLSSLPSGLASMKKRANPLMALRGLRTSWAMPAAILPSATRRSRRRSSLWRRRISPRSRMIKAVPMASPSSVTMCEELIASGTRRSPTVHHASCSLAASCAVRPSSTAHTPGSRS